MVLKRMIVLIVVGLALGLAIVVLCQKRVALLSENEMLTLKGRGEGWGWACDPDPDCMVGWSDCSAYEPPCDNEIGIRVLGSFYVCIDGLQYQYCKLKQPPRDCAEVWSCKQIGPTLCGWDQKLWSWQGNEATCVW